jgi:BirA family biotin operon repressor/biotin-[acetyl-CoA-carboxylase] ligase
LIGEPLETEQGSYRHLAVEQTASTNTLCLDYAAAGEAGNLWITAETQTGGKGSRGRDWQSQKGNLFASLLLTNPSEKSRLADLTFIAALSVREAILNFSTSSNQVEVKWPNDVMLNDRKCSGILLESVHHHDATYVVVGIGVNCQHFPAQTLHPSTSLFAEGIEVSSNRFFRTLANTMASNISIWKSGEKFSEIRSKWLDCAYKLGSEISVHIPGESATEGRFASIDENGYMLLELNDGSLRQISTADIFFKKTDNGQ